MQYKSRKFKQIIALLIAVCSLLGVSYAYWDDATSVMAFINTGKIDLDYKSTPYKFCAFEHRVLLEDFFGVEYQCRNERPTLTIINNGTVPIVINSIKVKSLTYDTTKYEDKWTHLFPHHLIIFKGDDIKKGEEIKIEKDITALNGEEIAPQKSSPTITLDIDYDSLVQEINKKVPVEDRYENGEGNTHGINNINVDKKGILKVEVDYSQWNTKKGWRKTKEIDIDTKWIRANYDKRFGIRRRYPSVYPKDDNEDTYAVLTVYNQYYLMDMLSETEESDDSSHETIITDTTEMEIPVLLEESTNTENASQASKSKSSTESTSQTSETKPSTESTSQTSGAKPSTESISQAIESKPSTESTSQAIESKPSTESTSQTSETKPSTESTSQTSETKPSRESTSQTSEGKPSTESTSQASEGKPSTESTGQASESN